MDGIPRCKGRRGDVVRTGWGGSSEKHTPASVGDPIMQHPKSTFARLACAVVTATVLAWPVILPGAAGERAVVEPTSLEALRQKVLVNEAKTRRIRMTYTNIPDSNMENWKNPATANGTAARHLIYSYAQDGVRRHVTTTAIGLDGRPISWHVEVTDGEVRKSSSQLDLMEGWITSPEKFSVSAPGPLWTAFNPFVDRLLLSECLVPEYASVCQDHATLGGEGCDGGGDQAS